MREFLLVLALVGFNPSPEARISSSLSHRPLLSRAEHPAMQALINTGMAILSVTDGGVGRGQVHSLEVGGGGTGVGMRQNQEKEEEEGR